MQAARWLVMIASTLIAVACSGGDDENNGSGDNNNGTAASGNSAAGSGNEPGGGSSGNGSFNPGNGVGGDGNGSSGSGNGCDTTFSGVIRDFQQEHPDFEHVVADDRGLVEDQLGEDGKPVYAHGEDGTRTTTGKANFDQWFRDVPGVNQSKPWVPEFERAGDNVYSYQDSSFFPIDDELFGNERNPHNYHFTYELHTEFVYNGGEEFTFRGDDDVFTFINGRLVVDLGGVHGVQEETISLDELAEDIGLVQGQRYPLDFFFAERHLSESNFRIDTTIVFVDCQGNPIIE